MSRTEEEWNAEEAQNMVQPARDVRTNQIAGIALINLPMPADHPVIMLEDKNLARAVAVRIVELANLLPEPPRILRRSTGINDELRGLDG